MTLSEIRKQYPNTIPTRVAALYMDMDPNTLRNRIKVGVYPFAESDITATVKAISDKSGLTVVGMENRIKTMDSYLRKLGSSDSDINDILRYTYTADPEKLTDKTLKSLAEYEKSGYNINRVKNFWLDSANPYKGVNVIMETAYGQTFELQYHTPASFALKDGKMHELYEQWRKLGASNSKREVIYKEMFALSSKLEVPQGIEKVRSR